MTVGERWAYRKQAAGPLVEVEILGYEEGPPARVVIKYVEDGTDDSVPPTRLRVPWAEVDDFRAREGRWEHARSFGVGGRENGAAEYVIATFLDHRVARTGHGKGNDSLLFVEDIDVLVGELGWSRSALLDVDGVFYDEPKDIWVGPWPVTASVAKTLAKQKVEALAIQVAADERQAQHENLYGYVSRDGHHISPETCSETDAEFGQPVREVVRSWCGEDALSLADEVLFLREEVNRLGGLFSRAIGSLRSTGKADVADSLEEEFKGSSDRP